MIDKKRTQRINNSVLAHSVDQLKRSHQYMNHNAELNKTLIGSSHEMNELRRQIFIAARSPLTVMIQGETGTGKELTANAVHQYSDRNKHPFIAVNCAAIPENLLESELFGHVKGAFTGAYAEKQGLVAKAHGGTLFLDEIGDMSLTLQAKLLRILESKKFRPVGGTKDIAIDFRLVTASHVNLYQQALEKQFRLDLFHRINQFVLNTPALSIRKQDIAELSQFFVSQYNLNNKAEITGIRHAAIKQLQQLEYTGNVRQLKNLLDFTCAMTLPGSEIELETLNKCITSQQSQTHPVSVSHSEIDQPDFSFSEINDLNKAVNEYEKHIIFSRLKEFNGSRKEAAQSLGIPKRTLAHKCQKMEIYIK